MKGRWGSRGLATAAVLGAWAALFWFLLVTGRTSLYLSSRTNWVVPVGAILLTAATIGKVITLRSAEPEPLTRGETWRLALIALPVLTVLALPPAALGSFAASQRSLTGAGFVSSAGDLSSGTITLADVARANWAPDGMKELAKRAGSEVTFVGIVARRDGMPADEFLLTRFIISCCVADALSVQVRIVGAPPGAFEEDDWVQVTGSIFPVPHEVIVDARSVRAVPRPENPYLSV